MKALGKGSIAWVLDGLLTIAWWLTVLAGSAVVLAFVVMLFTGTPSSDLLDAPIDFELDPGVYSVNAKSLGASAVTIKDATGMLAFDSGSRPVIAAYLIIVIVVVAVLLFILHQLRRIFRSLAEGRPFSAENAARIRMIGLVVVFGELAESLFVFVTQLYVVSSVVTSGITIKSSIDLDVSAIFVGLVLLVIAEVFRLGSELQEERDLTV